MKLTKEFQPLHITIETKKELDMFRDVFYSYIRKTPAFFGSFTSMSNQDKTIQDLYKYFEDYCS